MTTNLTITVNTSHRGLSAYRVFLTETDDALRPLTQTGPVFNGAARYEGVFHSKIEAVSAAVSYVATPHVLAEYRDMLTGDTSVRIERHDLKRAPALGWRRSVLASVSPSGTWLAA